MKTRKKLTFTFLTLALAGAFLITGCKEGNSVTPDDGLKKIENPGGGNVADCSCIVNPSDEISPEEEALLKYMREEEKLARDVYITLSSQYSLKVFSNISNSEQKHMDQVLCLLDHYNIEDPASEEIGVFSNPDLQELYDNLVDQGSESLIAALTVGATIEDVDIYDLDEFIGQTENEAIITIFEHLRCGSTNHMRAFSRLLDNNDTEYVPQFISQEEYDEILSGENGPCGNGKGNKGKGKSKGKGNGNGNGNGNGDCNGNGKGK